MPQPIDRSGTFRGHIVEYELYPPQGNRIALRIIGRMTEWWNPDEKAWEDWKDYEMEATGFLTLISKKGEQNDFQVERLAHAGWKGSYTNLATQAWNPEPCQFVVKDNDLSVF